MKGQTDRGNRKRLPRSFEEALAMGFAGGDAEWVESQDGKIAKGQQYFYLNEACVIIPFTAIYKFGRPRRPNRSKSFLKRMSNSLPKSSARKE